MHENIQKALSLWHRHFAKEENRYTEFEASDIEYFIGCMLYNHFNFTKALPNLKTMDLSYDFLTNCGDEEYTRVKELIDSIVFDDEGQALEFLQGFISHAKTLYSPSELYLINRLEKHIDSLAQRYELGLDAPSRVDFSASLFARR
ncbi:MAG: hypothetical protein IE916_02820 [Epsilonproteobacteria bacterium]|nr:hypothetical protein [Campylobacterota bacterium]